MKSPDKYNYFLQERTLELAEYLRSNVSGFYYGLLMKSANISPGVCFRGNKRYCELSICQVGCIHNTQVLFFNVSKDGVTFNCIWQSDIEDILPRKSCIELTKAIQNDIGVNIREKEYVGDTVHDWFTDFLDEEKVELICEKVIKLFKNKTFTKRNKEVSFLYDKKEFERLVAKHPYTLQLNEDGSYSYIQPKIMATANDDDESEIELSDNLSSLYEQLKAALENENYELVNDICYKISVINATDGEPLAETDYTKYFRALRTKPFLLLAGISGTGKSRIVRELAFRSCPAKLQDKDCTTPGNYCMIEVKPNWHDSTELLGYYSNINRCYHFTRFIDFLVLAHQNPDTPFFLCLDEMNLAPVEQYFAEFLSVLETRRYLDNDEGRIVSGTIVEGKYMKEHLLWQSDADLTIPDNLFVIGTVNMDDTTHQFSRKVIDRAMTIEMNGEDLDKMFGGSKNLSYTEEWSLSDFQPKHIQADEVIKEFPFYDIKKDTPALLSSVNAILKGTPFEVSYRVLNELCIYLSVLLEDGLSYVDALSETLDQIMLMKVLPRIEGDEDMFAVKDSASNRLEQLIEFLDGHDCTCSVAKLREMNDKLQSGFTRFWP